MPTSTTKKEITRDQAIRLGGITNAVIASGAPCEEWYERIRYGLQLNGYFAQRLLGEKPVAPAVPDFKESK